MKIFRDEGSVSSVQTPESEPAGTGAAPDLSDVSQSDHAEAPAPRRKRYLTIPEGEGTRYLKATDLKAFVATIPDDALICFIDVGEGQGLYLRELDAGLAIVGKP
jgi:hypothetical protein